MLDKVNLKQFDQAKHRRESDLKNETHCTVQIRENIKESFEPPWLFFF